MTRGRADSPAPSAAVDRVRVRALAARTRDEQRVEDLLRNVPGEILRGRTPAELAESLMRHRVTVNFHPDRIASNGLTAAQGLSRDGIFRTQYETGTGAGSPTAYPGGDRERWEAQLFGDDHRTTVPAHRPRYGGLNLTDAPDGACPRFGSCYLIVAPDTLRRATFCVEDSHRSAAEANDGDLGTVDESMSLLAGVLERAAKPTGDFPWPAGDLPTTIATIMSPRPDLGHSRANGTMGRIMDSTQYVEAQIHGEFVLSRDATAIVVDASYVGTPTLSQLQAAADANDVKLLVHQGFALPPKRLVQLVPGMSDFRGPAVIELARRLHGAVCLPDEPLTASALGAGIVTVPDANDEPKRQQLKQLWHLLVAFGDAAQPQRSDAE